MGRTYLNFEVRSEHSCTPSPVTLPPFVRDVPKSDTVIRRSSMMRSAMRSGLEMCILVIAALLVSGAVCILSSISEA